MRDADAGRRPAAAAVAAGTAAAVAAVQAGRV